MVAVPLSTAVAGASHIRAGEKHTVSASAQYIDSAMWQVRAGAISICCREGGCAGTGPPLECMNGELQGQKGRKEDKGTHHQWLESTHQSDPRARLVPTTDCSVVAENSMGSM